MRVVIDTNVLISGLLSLYSYPARVIDLVYVGRFHCVYDDRIMTEYTEVLSRPRFKNVISDKERKNLLAYVVHSGIHVLAGPLEDKTFSAPDPDDMPFVEAAVAGQADCVITGNKKHFSFFINNPWTIKVLSPRECYDLIRRT